MRRWCNLAAKESGLECTCMNNDDFTVLVSGGSRYPWENLCTVWLLHSKWVSNESASNFVWSLNIPPQKLFGWFRRPQLWATGDWRLRHNNAPAFASRLLQNFLVKHQITQMTQPRYGPDLAPCDFWLFPKRNHLWKGRDFRQSLRFKEMVQQLMAIGRTVWGTKVPTSKGTEASLSYVQCFLCLLSSSINVSIFHSMWLDTFWTDLSICLNAVMPSFS